MVLKITGKTKLLGIIGDPIEHSLSPIIQNRALELKGLDYLYVPFAVKGDNLATALNGFWVTGIHGFNVTIPHKQAVMPLLKHISPSALLIGAVNTVWRMADGWHGTNTDLDGFIAPLQRLNRCWQDISPLIIGNGGAARAVVVGCAKLGCKNIQVIGRNQEKLAQFKDSWDYAQLNAHIDIYTMDQLSSLIPVSELIVNTTPMGMSPNSALSPLSLSDMELLSPSHIVYDLIYNPSPTVLLQQAQQQGATIIDGTEMLVQQGAVGFQIWTGETPPLEEMGRALLDHLLLS